MKLQALAVLTALGGIAFADDDGAVTGFEATGSGPISGRALDASGKPLRHVDIHVVSKSGGERIVQTDEDGAYSVTLKAASTETSMIYVRGHRGAYLGGMVSDSTVVDGAEAIEIHETLQPATLAKPPDKFIHIHAYTPRAVKDNEWARAWITLDIDTAGHVLAYRWMKRPGHDLDQIVQLDAFKLMFEPARDRANRAVASQLVWMFEWPTYSWLAGHDVHEQGSFDFTKLPADYATLPCQQANQHRKDRRDCSQPDIRSSLGEAWIHKSPPPVAPKLKG